MMDIETWSIIRYLSLSKNLTVPEIAKKIGRDPKTVRRALKQDSFLATTRKPRRSILEPYYKDIKELVDEYPHLSGVRIFEELKKLGYQGQISILREYLTKLRATRQDPHFRLSVPAGMQAQVDWGHCGHVTIGSTTRPLYCFAIILSFSRVLHLEFTLTMTQETFLEAHVKGFQFFGGCPREVLYDNLSSVVRSRTGDSVRMNSAFLDFAGFYGFRPRVCNVAKPREKGKVEMSIKYIKQNFLPGRIFTSFFDLRYQALKWRDEIANVRIHGTTRQRPIDLLQEERLCLLSLPDEVYDTSYKHTFVCPPDGFVRFQTNLYSVPFTCVGKQLLLKAGMHTIQIFDRMTLIAEHRRCYDRHQCIENSAHRKKLLEQRSKAAFSKVFEELCSTSAECKEYIEGLNRAEINVKSHVMRIIQLSRIYGVTEMKQAIAHALTFEAFGADYIENIIVNNRRKRHAKNPTGPVVIISRPDLISLSVTPHSMSSYEAIEEVAEPRNEPSCHQEDHHEK